MTSIRRRYRCSCRAAKIAGADMTDRSFSIIRPGGLLERAAASPVTRTTALLALCAAYIQGPLTKIFDFPGAIAEMEHFGLYPAPLFAVGVIVFELAMSALV